jgi:hypothetical protein
MTRSLSGRCARLGASMLVALAVFAADDSAPKAHEHEHTHRKLTAAAVRFLNSDFFRTHPDGEEFIVREIAQGAVDEDLCVGSSFGQNWGLHVNFYNHFLPQTPDVPSAPLPGCSTAGFSRTDAASRAGTLWTMAISDYRRGNRQSAYRILGRVLHLLEDMTSPAHVHGDPHAKLTPSCGNDADDFEQWGHCDGFSDRISDYISTTSAHRPCGSVNGVQISEPVHSSFNCRLWWALERLYAAVPQGGTASANPVSPHAHQNIAYSFIHHVRDVTAQFTSYYVHLDDTTNATNTQPDSELRRMLHTANSCGAIFGSNSGLCDINDGFSITGSLQDIGRAEGRCGRWETFEGDLGPIGPLTEEWWVQGGSTCERTEGGFPFFPVTVTGFAYIENSGGNPSTGGFIPARYGCTTADSEFCGDFHGTVTGRSKPLYARLYGDHTNHSDPFTGAATAKSQLRIYGDVLYATAVAYGAGLLERFVEAVDDPPTVTLDKTSLRFGAVTDGTRFLAQTSAQSVRLSESGHGHVRWTATSSQPWLTVSPSTGTSSATLSIAVRSTGAPATGGATGTITFTLENTASTPGPITVVLTTTTPASATAPAGFVDTPLNNATGVAGGMPVTGWALDDIEVARVAICRAGVAGETPPPTAECNGATQFYLGNAVFIEGARPDVQAAYPHVPHNSRAGWGFMILTNMLPNGGNGLFTFFAHALDQDGHTTMLGSRSITAANALSHRPFGAIDTPSQGGTASGSHYTNFAWALTPQPATIPLDGSTISVLVDGVNLGAPSYNHARADIAALFPGLNNSAGPVGFKTLDTSTLHNGLHTIVWVVSNNVGDVAGIGSRYFEVINGLGALTAAATTEDAAAAAGSLPADRTPIWGRRSYDANAPWRSYRASLAGPIVVRAEEIDRIELRLGPGGGEQYSGYLRVGDASMPLPVGSTLDAERGTFVWQPGVGFVGAYDLVFLRTAGSQAARVDVRVILSAKGAGHVGPQVVIDAPRAESAVRQPFMVGGWAADLSATSGTGIGGVHVWAYPVAGGAPIFVGTAARGRRPDVAALHGDQFLESGYGMFVQGLASGAYDLAVFAWSDDAADFVPAKVVRVMVE